MSLVLWAMMSAATYRIGALALLDEIFDVPRQKFYEWLTSHPRWLTLKLQTLMTCPYCLTVWISGGVVLAVDLWGVPLPLPVLQWGATAAGSLVFWRYIDPRKPEEVKKKK